MKVDNLERPAIWLDSVVLDCKDPKSLADFYERLLDWRRSPGGEEWDVVCDPNSKFRIYFQKEPDYVPPVWPASPGCQQVMTHLDFATSDLDAAVDYAISCGARLADTQYLENARVCIDPEGHPFCLCKH